MKSVFQEIRITFIFWPANSPDLNLIETIWDMIKDYIQKHYLKVHRLYKRLRSAVQKAWELITLATIQELIRGMSDRCINMILADKGCLKY